LWLFSPVTQLKGPKGDGDMEAGKRDYNAPPNRDLNLWLCGRQSDLSVMGVKHFLLALLAVYGR